MTDIAIEMVPVGAGDLKRDDTGWSVVREENQAKNVTVSIKQGDEYYGPTGVNADAEEAEDSDVIIKCDNIHKTYLLNLEGIPALRGVSLSIKRGEFVVVFGTSGGGKTTLLNILGTIDKPSRGYLYICGQKISSSTKDSELADLRLRKLGFVFQTFNLLGSLTARENVEMPMLLAGRLTPSERKQRATELLESVGMGARLDHVPSQLSGGEQQRVTIARSIANEPEILLLDEPTGDLDSANTLRVLALLTRLNAERGLTLVLVTHDIGLKYFANRVLWMRDGKLQRVERVSDRKRAEMIANLNRDVEALGMPPMAEASRPQLVEAARWTNTDVRQPTAYEAVRGIAAVEADLRHMDKSFIRKKDQVIKREQLNKDEEMF